MVCRGGLRMKRIKRTIETRLEVRIAPEAARSWDRLDAEAEREGRAVRDLRRLVPRRLKQWEVKR